MSILKGYKPEKMLGYFEEICKIPHGSGNEEEIAAYIVAFAKERGLFCVRDSENNVFIRKSATKGYEDAPAILLQGHPDMVCEKNSDSNHDFKKDPLDLYIENGMLRARGTTLGGDDGAAVAAMLAILDSDDIDHPVLECLFTTAEETGMYGAVNFDCSLISAKKLINLDTEKDGEAIAACAGSADVEYILDTDRISCGRHILKISVSGLAGGHSGADIHLGRQNANRIMGRILARVYEDDPFNIVSVRGGNMKNAIARECFAEIVPEDIERAKAIVYDEAEKLAKEMCAEDKSLRITASRGKIVDTMLSYKDSSAVINMMTLPHNGVYAMSPEMEGFVRTSSNNGVVATEDSCVKLNFMPRSSCDSELSALLVSFKRIAKAIGCRCEISERSMGWDLVPDSALASSFIKCYKELFPGSEPYVTAIHAGLECGVFVSKTGCDALSIGPDIYNIHSPDEALDIASCERFWKLLVRMLGDK